MSELTQNIESGLEKDQRRQHLLHVIREVPQKDDSKFMGWWRDGLTKFDRLKNGDEIGAKDFLHGFLAGWLETGDDVAAAIRWTGRDMKSAIKTTVADMAKQLRSE